MEMTRNESLARYRDTSVAAISLRLRAALKVAQISQKDMASQLEISPTTLNSQFTKGRPSNDTMVFFHRNHRVDLNFIIHGDLAQLSGDVQNALIAALADEA